MSLLKRFFKASTPDLPTRIQALENTPTDQLMDISLGNEPEALREAAIARLPYTQTLRDLATGAHAARIQTAARKRIGQLLDEGQLELIRLSQDLKDEQQLLLLAGYSPAASLNALEQIKDQSILLQLATEGTTTQVRQAAAAKLEQRSSLEQLLKAAQGKDKNVYRIAKTKLDTFRAEDVRLANIGHKALELCKKMEALSRLESDPLFAARLTNIESEWAHLAPDVAPELAARYEKALAFCRQAIAEQEQTIAAEKQQLAQVLQAQQTLNTALAAVKHLIAELYACPDSTHLANNHYTQQLSNLKASTEAAREVAAGDVSSTEFDHLHQNALKLLELLQEVGPLAALVDTFTTAEDAATQTAAAESLRRVLQFANALPSQQQPMELQAAQAALNSWREQKQQQEKQQKDALRQVSELCRRGLHAAEQGHVRKARGIHKELLEKIEPLAPLSEALQAKVDSLNAAIEKLSDWHDFAVTPKKHELIAEMQALAKSNLAPPDLADRIHTLQENWKTLSKGVQQQDEDLWEAFQQASHVAYEPCKAFFEGQAEEREQNLARREKLMEQVSTYLRDYDWENAVWKDVEQTLKVARQEWQNAWPIPRKAAANLQKKFDALMDELHGKLSSEYQNNKEKKASIIGQAQLLLELTDLHQATEQAKQLQTQWKQVGRTWVRDEQALWKSFRKVCDDIFARKKAEYDAARHERAEVEQQAEGLLNKLAALGELTGQALIDARTQAAGLKNEFEQVGELPNAAAGRLRGRLHDHLNAINEKIDRERQSAEVHSWDALLEISNQIREAELAAMAGKLDALSTAEAAMAQVARWPQNSRQLLEQRLQGASGLTEKDQEQTLEALHILAIRAEILTGVETPPADKTRRMAYQVEQLQQGLGRREDSLNALVLEWLTHPAAPTKDYQQLLQRFNQCRQKS